MGGSTVNDLEVMAGLRSYPLARRGLMMSGLMSGLTLATTRVEAQVIHTDTAGLDAGEVKIPEADTELPGYFARPQGAGPFPIVVVNEEVFGIHEYIKDTCRRLGKLGYLAVAVEIYARIGDLSKATDVMPIVSKAPDATVMSDLDGAVKWAAANKGDAGRIGVTGFCRGGRNTWMYAAHNPNVKAAVAWYGRIMGTATDIQPKRVIDIADQINCPLLGLYGGQDAGIKVDDVQAAAAKARAAGKTVEIVVYPDAPHGFHADYRPSYRAADAADGWQRMQDWFKKYGVA
jgi:carboxymethylenebutenolidase